MADHSHIEWTDATWNPITGCSVVSPGCIRCYAMRLAGTRLKHHPSRAGLTTMSKTGPVWNGELRLNRQWLHQPLGWKKPRMIFVCAHGDLFHESVPDKWIDHVFAVMALTPHHTFQMLTKRSERMREYLSAPSFGIRVGGELMKAARGNVGAECAVMDIAHRLTVTAKALPNVWLGVSAEDQARADERVPDLLATPAAIRFVSAEPLLGPIDFRRLRVADISATAGFPMADALVGSFYLDPEKEAPFTRALIEENRRASREPDGIGLDWIIVGGESGAGARPMHPDWARSIRDQCAVAHVPFFFKQWGSHQVVYDRDVEDPDWRRCGAVERAYPAGRWLNLAGGHGFHGERVVYVNPTIKHHAGRLLDGVEHNGMPKPREVPAL